MSIDNIPLFSAMNREEVKPPCHHTHRPPMTSQEAHMEILARVEALITDINNFKQRVKFEVDKFMRESGTENTAFKEAIQESYNTFLVTVQREVNNFETAMRNDFDLHRGTVEQVYSDFQTLISNDFKQLHDNVIKASNDKIAEMESLRITLNNTFLSQRAELVGIVNTYKSQVEAHMIEQDKKIEDYKKHMVDNILDSTKTVIEQKTKTGEIESIMKSIFGSSRRFMGSAEYQDIIVSVNPTNGDYWYCTDDGHYYMFTEYGGGDLGTFVDIGTDDKIVDDYNTFKVNVFQYRGAINDLNYTKFSQCTKDGVYDFHRTYVNTIEDKPLDLDVTGILIVVRVDGVDGALTNQTLIAVDGRTWSRVISFANPNSAFKRPIYTSYKGDVIENGFTTFAECLENGNYSFMTKDAPSFSDKPTTLTTGGSIMTFIRRDYLNDANAYNQLLIGSDGHMWIRSITMGGVQPWIDLSPDYSSYEKYNGNVTELGYTSFFECRKPGHYAFHRTKLESITDKPNDLALSGVLNVRVMSGTSFGDYPCYYQTIVDFDGNKWERFISIDGATAPDYQYKNTEFVKISVDDPNPYPLYITKKDIGAEIDSTEKVYALYDALCTTYPDYVSKSVIGKNSVGQDINEYTFSTGNYNDVTPQRAKDEVNSKPVVLIVSGVHGYERSDVLSTYKFIHDMCSFEKTLLNIRENYIVKVIPVATPWAFDNNKRVNENGVNINRNFTVNWESIGTLGDNNDYSGASACDQLETKALENWITSNSDAILYVDHHNSGYTDEVSYLAGNNSIDGMVEMKNTYLKALYETSAYWKKELSLPSSLIFAYTGDFTAMASSQNFAGSKGMLSVCLETSWEQNGDTRHGALTNKIGAEALGNMLRNYLK